jgi:general secretion pathway protein L
VAVLPLSSAALALLHIGTHLPANEGDAPAVYAEPAVAALAEKILARPVQLASHSSHALLAARGAWDLAQFDLASSGRIRALRKAGGAINALLHAPQWRAARWGVALLLLAHLLGLNLWAWQERQSLAAKQASVRSVLTQTFAHVKVVVDAPVQMERELARLRQAAGALSAQDLEPLLALSARALPATWQASAIDYSGGQLRLRGPALSANEQAHASDTARALPATWQASAIDYSGGQLRLRGPALSANEQAHASDTARASGYQLHTEGDTVQVRAATAP